MVARHRRQHRLLQEQTCRQWHRAGHRVVGEGEGGAAVAVTKAHTGRRKGQAAHRLLNWGR